VSLSDLTGTLAAGPPYIPRQAEAIARATAGRPAVLIGHSGAGPLLPLAGARAGIRVQGYVFVDARLPAPGQSWMDAVPA
jgi:pimeloyl-ACP methyl ester carboxylesterase